MRNILGLCLILCLSVGLAKAQPSEFNIFPTNASGTMYGQATINGIPATGADWVAAFDMDGNCAGAAALVMNENIAYLNLPIYGDDATSPEIDEGISGGESFTLWLWRASTNQILPYPNATNTESFSGWTNTNGAPIPGLDDVTMVYDFFEENLPCDASILTEGPFCADAESIELEAATSGGSWSGTGVISGSFNPSLLDPGTYLITYTLGEIGSSCYEVSTAEFVIYPSVGEYDIVWWDNYGVPEEDWISQVCITSDDSISVQWFNIDLTDMGEYEACLENSDPSGTYYAVITNEYGCSITTENVDFVNAVEEFGFEEGEDMVELIFVQNEDFGGVLNSNFPIEEILVYDMQGREIINSPQDGAKSCEVSIPSNVRVYILLVKTKVGYGTLKFVR
jgi:hypothetical protein